jgi:chemotaxis protein MotB
MIVSSRSRWKLSVIDVLFILIIFFVIVLSHSTLDISKFTLFKHRKGEISGDRGILSSRRSLSGPPMVKPIYPGRKKAMKKIKTTIEKLKERYPYLKGFKIVEKEKSIKLNLPEKITFESGSYFLNPGASVFIKEICPVLNDSSVERVILKGHTDNVPGTDNWVLSAKRAEAVLNIILKECKIPLSKLELMACADTEPIAPNDTPSGRAKNRRVEIELIFKGEQVVPGREERKERE